MPKKALIVVDMINDFRPTLGALPVEGMEEIVGTINTMTAYARKNGWLLIAVREWHPPETIHFDKWPVHGVRGTKGAEFHPDIDVDGFFMIYKGTGPNEHGLSGFEGHTNAGKGMSLEKLLHYQRVEENYICGVATDYCDKATGIDSAHAGFKTYLLLDACRAVDLNPGDGERAVEEMRHEGVIITSVAECIGVQRG